jgi:hypothetical protein
MMTVQSRGVLDGHTPVIGHYSQQKENHTERVGKTDLGNAVFMHCNCSVSECSQASLGPEWK